MKLLYVTSRLPVPPLVKGDTLRDFHIIRELASRGHKITLVSYYRKDENTSPSLPLLTKYLSDIKLIPFSIRKQARNLYGGLYTLKPFQVLLYNSPVFSTSIRHEIETGTYDLAYTHFARMGDFLLGYDIPKILDLQDSLRQNTMDRYYKYKKQGNILMQYVSLFDSFKMNLYEKQTLHQFNACLVVSDRDIPEGHPNIHVIPNGIEAGRPLPFKRKEKDGIIFFGDMAYFSNNDAAIFLIKKIMPLVWQKKPKLKIYIAGHAPGKALKKLVSDRVIVTGFVPNLEVYFRKAHIAVSPLRLGTGMQNKVLEAMRSGLPQIVTEKGAGGFRNLTGKEFITTSEDKHAIANAIIELLQDETKQQKLITESLAYLKTNYSWEKSIDEMEILLFKAIQPVDNTSLQKDSVKEFIESTETSLKAEI